MEPGRVGAVVLAAGAGSRFGDIKALAKLDGRPILQHVLDAVAESGLEETVVVLGRWADVIDATIRWRGEQRVRNLDPDAGLSSSLRVGIGALGGNLEAALLVLGDQPLLRPATVAALLAALDPGSGSAAVPVYAEGGGQNPVLLGRPAWPLVLEATGDRGLGPVLRAHWNLVREVPVSGANPDVDTHGDLAALAWGERVRANREQVDRVREVPDGPDFYAPVTAHFLADPRRTDDPVLEVLRSLVRPADTWLDVGAGAGRFALPIALLAHEVVALDSSAGMLAVLREQAARAGVGNIRTIEARWPIVPGSDAVAPTADVSLIASVGHDVERIGDFLDTVESVAQRLCVAVMSQRQPASFAERFWPPLHGEARIALPALPELLELLRARGRAPELLATVEQPPRDYPDEDALAEFVRLQLWVAPGGPKDRRLRELIRAELAERDGRVSLKSERPRRVGVVCWEPR
ncbi:MAG: NTP transferase domain-containing protein [Candidatus Limnocylindrales bacterium]